ncbi:acyltransferase family protein [Fictibacillus sp. b24]|uniref:acyltransferase family protein n=1 Tax=Fictibacillus sp. b24 TaxID=3055863 RepID=UPI00338FB5BC
MNKQNLTLQGFRGLLALLVVVFHSYRGLVSSEQIHPLQGHLKWVESAGLVSVNLFFVISGYLILQSLYRHQNANRFLIDRILRIYPVFLVVHLLLFTAGPMIGYKWMENLSLSDYLLHFFSNLFLLPGIFSFLPEAQIVAWSLSYEFLFYLLIGSYFTSRQKGNNYKNQLLLLLTVLLATLFLYFHPIACFFVVGILIYKWIGRINTIRNYKPIFYFNGLILFIFIYVFYDKVNLTISLVLSFFLFISITNEEGILSTILKTKIFKYLGDISYSLYIWHTVIMFPLKLVMNKVYHFPQSPWLLFFTFSLLSVVISLIVSHLSYIWIEKKFTNYIKGILRGRQQLKDVLHERAL